MDYKDFLNFLSITATASTIGLFLCGVQICSRIRRRGSTDGTGVAPFLLTSISCICWLGYGILKDDQTIIFVNAIGLLFQTVYLTYYYIKTRLKSRLNRLIGLEIFVCFATFSFVRSHIELSVREDVLGFICMLLNIATFSAPLVDVGQVIRSKNTESLPFMLCLGNLIVSVQWFIYGLLTEDLFIKIPNGISVIISTGQLSLFIIYPQKYKMLIITKPDEL